MKGRKWHGKWLAGRAGSTVLLQRNPFENSFSLNGLFVRGNFELTSESISSLDRFRALLMTAVLSQFLYYS